jgi:hypothetical protein
MRCWPGSLDAGGSFPGLIRALGAGDIDGQLFDRRVSMPHRDSAVAVSSSITGRRKGVPAIDSTGVLA